MFVNLRNEGKNFKAITIIFMITATLSIVTFALTMAFYPGGHPWDTTQVGYSLLYNAICDLCPEIAINGEPNILSRIFLLVTTTVQTLGVTLFFSVFYKLFQERKLTKYLSLIGSSFLLMVGPFNYVIFLLHRTRKFHMTVVVINPILLVLAVILYTIVLFKTSEMPKISSYSMLTLASLSMIYSVLVGIASTFDEITEQIIHRMGNSLLQYIIAIVYICLGIGVIHYLKKSVEK
jgi:hypothetical protein